MANLNLRGVPEPVHALLRREAKASHQSVTAVAIRALEEYAARVERRNRLERAAAEMDRVRRSIARRRPVTTDSASLLASDRAR
jgi:hypothetical protein